MEYSDKNEHLNDDPLENTNHPSNEPTGSEKDLSKANPPEKSKAVSGKSGDVPVPGTDTTAKEDENTAANKAPREDMTESEAVRETEDPAVEDEKKVKKDYSDFRTTGQMEIKEETQPEKDKKVKGGVEEKEEKKEKEEKGEKPAHKDIETHKDIEAKEDTEKNVAQEDMEVKKEKKEKEEKEGQTAKEEKAKKAEKKEQATKEEKEEEKINYELLSKPDLVKLLQDLMNNKTFGQLRNTVDEIQEVYQKKVEEEYAEKKQKFIEEGGLEQDFKPVDDPADKVMEELLEKYKVLKADFNKQLEAEKEVNLKAKEEILEEFRILMEGQEGFENTFRKFKQLQKRWFDIGIVPKQNVRDLWNSYNFFVDKFNDYVRINKELRVLDLKKNLDLKLKLCEKAEMLTEEKNISNAFKILQKYHAQWRDIGPVPREDKDALWQRFKAATSVINKAHQQFQSELKDSLVENLEKKIVLCEKAEAIAALDLNKHGDWVQKTNELLNIQKEWKTIGYAPKKDNNQIYARFRRACDTFFDRKANFYAKTFEHQKDNLEQKLEIIQLAEELKDSKDWKSTTDKLIDLQKQWKEIGPVPRKESDKLWRRFRSACDYFFNAKSDFFGGKNESYEDNLKEKKTLIEEMSKFDPSGNRGELISALEDFQSRYNEIGFVPVEAKDKIRDDFKNAVNDIIDKTGEPEEEKVLLRYRIRITAILNSPRSENKIRFERDKMMNKLQQLRNDIGVWENNIGFFKQTESSEDTLSEFNEKIEDAHKRIDQLEQKIRIIDELDDSM